MIKEKCSQPLNKRDNSMSSSTYKSVVLKAHTKMLILIVLWYFGTVLTDGFLLPGRIYFTSQVPNKRLICWWNSSLGKIVTIHVSNNYCFHWKIQSAPTMLQLVQFPKRDTIGMNSGNICACSSFEAYVQRHRLIFGSVSWNWALVDYEKLTAVNGKIDVQQIEHVTARLTTQNLWLNNQEKTTHLIDIR